MLHSRREGIDLGRRAVNFPRPVGDRLLAGQYDLIRQHDTLVGPNGEALQPSTPARRECCIAFAQGFIAAYRSGTEH